VKECECEALNLLLPDADKLAQGGPNFELSHTILFPTTYNFGPCPFIPISCSSVARSNDYCKPNQRCWTTEGQNMTQTMLTGLLMTQMPATWVL